MKILHASLLYVYKLLNRICPLCKTCFFFFFSFVFHTKIRLHSNIAIHMWHPLSDESSLTSPIYETRSGSQKTHSNTDQFLN